MIISGLESAYEAARTWALYPIAQPPAGWAQIIRRGMASFVHERSERLGAMNPTPPLSPAPGSAQRTRSLLLMLVATMMMEVCP